MPELSSFNASNAHLDQMRQTGDPEADQLVDLLNRTYGRDGFRKVQPWLTSFTKINEAAPLPELEEWISQRTGLPPWVNNKQLRIAEALYQKHPLDLLIMLGCYSLPYCYAAADGARVLYYTERLRKDTYNRLVETGQFVALVTSPGALENERIRKHVVKVRVLHAFARWYLLNHIGWNPAWGLPANQEDTAGTNLAFSLIALRGLRRVNIPVSKAQADAYLHLWNVVAWLLGCHQSLLAPSFKEAWLLDQAIAKRHFKPSQEGHELAEALIDSMVGSSADEKVRKLAPALMHYFLGPDLVKLLDLKPVDNRWLVFGLKTFNFLKYSLRLPLPVPQPKQIKAVNSSL